MLAGDIDNSTLRAELFSFESSLALLVYLMTLLNIQANNQEVYMKRQTGQIIYSTCLLLENYYRTKNMKMMGYKCNVTLRRL